MTVSDYPGHIPDLKVFHPGRAQSSTFQFVRVSAAEPDRRLVVLSHQTLLWIAFHIDSDTSVETALHGLANHSSTCLISDKQVLYLTAQNYIRPLLK